MGSKTLLTYTLKNGQIVKGYVYSTLELCAKFQIWAKRLGLTEAESFAVWLDKDDELSQEKGLKYFNSLETVKKLANEGWKKLGQVQAPDLTEIT